MNLKWIKLKALISKMDSKNSFCCCGKMESEKENESNNFEACSSSKTKKNKINLPFIGRRRSLNLMTGRKNKKSQSILSSDENCCSSTTQTNNCAAKKSSSSTSTSKWPLKFGTKKETKIVSSLSNIQSDIDESNCCKCTCYKKKDENLDERNATSSSSVESSLSSSGSETTTSSSSSSSSTSSCSNSTFENSSTSHLRIDDEIQVEIRENRLDDDGFDESIYGVVPVQPNFVINAPFMDLCLRTIHEDCDEAARLARAREIEQGVDAPENFRPVRRVQLLCGEMEIDNGQRRRLQLVCPRDLSVDSLRALFHTNVTLKSCPVDSVNGCHTQVDFIHCLVPDLLNITNCSFYWGKMDRYEAERLLDGKPEGTFLLRDSAQEEYLFSVSFRKYARSLHARIEQWNHKFSFDSHDPGVFTSDTVCGLIEHYKDASSCMFFEPMLTFPLHRNYPFSLQHLSRAVITSRLTYDNINHLHLPKTLKTYLKEYHYRQKVRVKKFDDDVQWLELQNM